MTKNTATLRFDAVAGKVYFIWHNMKRNM